MEFSCILIEWYSGNKRDLPWRRTTDPYLIWISEVILQQTRVENGILYYNRFIQRFPDLESLAKADQNEVLKIWQGMGYYSRARKLHETARSILSIYKGNLPSDYKELRKLKGVGDYTAAAIASFSFNQTFPVLDGNVFRVLSRIFGIETPIDTVAGKKEFRVLAESFLDKNRPAIYNQAIMEFGALQCVPGTPDCTKCPFIYNCIAFQNKLISKLPVRGKKNFVKNRFFHYFHFILPDGTTLIYKRTGKDIWQSLFEFPMIEAQKLLGGNAILNASYFKELVNGAKVNSSNMVVDFTHKLTHQRINARFFQFEIYDFNFVSSLFQNMSLSTIRIEIPLHRLMVRYFEYLQNGIAK